MDIQHKFQLNGNTYLAVSVDPKLDGIWSFDRDRGVLMCIGTGYERKTDTFLEKVFGAKCIVVYPKGLTEEIASQMVDWWVIANNPHGRKVYRNYTFTSDVKPFDKATESFKSKMEAEKLFIENPYGKDPTESVRTEFKETSEHKAQKYNIGHFNRKWQDAQDRTSEQFLIIKLDV